MRNSETGFNYKSLYQIQQAFCSASEGTSRSEHFMDLLPCHSANRRFKVGSTESGSRMAVLPQVFSDFD
jgi:hypothetical protein